MRYFDEEASIPSLLRQQHSWLCWQKGETDARGKFPKYPVNPLNPKIKINYQNPSCLLSFESALSFYQHNKDISGLGFKLDEKPLKNDLGNEEYLVGIDVDMDEGRNEDFFNKIRNELDNTYSEISPSGKGIRLFGLSYDKIDNWSHNHIEVYSKNRFLTITGWNAQGDIKNITTLLKLFKKKYKPQDKVHKTSVVHQIKFPTPNEIANVSALLYSVKADCPGDEYRNIVFSILSLGWGDIGVHLVKTWSLTAPHRWNEVYFNDLVERFDSGVIGSGNTPISIGTLYHYAKNNLSKGRPF